MRIAVIAHDRKKAELSSFLREHRDFLRGADLVATATTGAHVAELGVGAGLTTVLSGPFGGDAQIAAMAAGGDLDLVIFFRDPLSSHPHEADVQMLARICDVHNVPLATNRATAALAVKSMFAQPDEEEEEDEEPVIQSGVYVHLPPPAVHAAVGA
ncbi:MAG: methylglyoxal synthase [Polyangiaceae bacterium]|nr:methylglyoxal synthase [Polyangiaceae bacterium]